MQDSEIIELFWQRDESAITVTVRQYGGYCHTIAYNILQSKEDAEECVNATWLAAWQSIPPQKPERLATYLGKLTRNISINRYHQANAQKRNIFIRRYWALYSIHEIAVHYGMSDSKVTSLLFRMRKALKALLVKEDIVL